MKLSEIQIQFSNAYASAKTFYNEHRPAIIGSAVAMVASAGIYFRKDISGLASSLAARLPTSLNVQNLKDNLKALVGGGVLSATALKGDDNTYDILANAQNQFPAEQIQIASDVAVRTPDASTADKRATEAPAADSPAVGQAPVETSAASIDQLTQEDLEMAALAKKLIEILYEDPTDDEIALFETPASAYLAPESAAEAPAAPAVVAQLVVETPGEPVAQPAADAPAAPAVVAQPVVETPAADDKMVATLSPVIAPVSTPEQNKS